MSASASASCTYAQFTHAYRTMTLWPYRFSDALTSINAVHTQHTNNNCRMRLEPNVLFDHSKLFIYLAILLMIGAYVHICFESKLLLHMVAILSINWILRVNVVSNETKPGLIFGMRLIMTFQQIDFSKIVYVIGIATSMKRELDSKSQSDIYRIRIHRLVQQRRRTTPTETRHKTGKERKKTNVKNRLVLSLVPKPIRISVCAHKMFYKHIYLMPTRKTVEFKQIDPNYDAVSNCFSHIQHTIGIDGRI